MVVCPKCSNKIQTLEAVAEKPVRCAICGYQIELLESSEPLNEVNPLESISTTDDTQNVSKLPELESPQRTGSYAARKLPPKTARYALIGVACVLVGAASVARLFFAARRRPSQNLPSGLVEASAQPVKKKTAPAQPSLPAAIHWEMKALERVAYRLPSSKDREKLLRFNRDVRPILSNHCFRCHGRDGNARKGGVQLDVREKALLPAESGAIPIVPGQPAKSELVRRIFSADASEAMPPPSANQPLTEAEKRFAQTVDRGRSQVRAALGVHGARTPATADRQTGRLAAQRDRQLHPGPAGTGGVRAVAADRLGDPFPAAVAGLDRPAPVTRPMSPPSSEKLRPPNAKRPGPAVDSRRRTSSTTPG